MGRRGATVGAIALLGGAGLLTLAALVAHAWINARAAADFLASGQPPFQFRHQAGVMLVTAVSPDLDARLAPDSPEMIPIPPLLAPGDQIARVAGIPVDGGARWAHPLRWRVAGRPLRQGEWLPLTLVRGGLASEVLVRLGAVPPESAQTVGRIRAMLLPKQVAGFGLWLLGTLALLRRRDFLARLFFLWCLALALYTAGSVIVAPLWDTYPPLLIQLFRSGFTTGWLLAPALFGHFCYALVRPAPTSPRRWWLPLLGYLLPLMALLASLHPTASPGLGAAGAPSEWLWRLLWHGLAASWVITLALGLAMLWRARQAAPDAVRRKQMELLLIGSLAYVAVFLHAFVTVIAGWDARPTGLWAWLPYLLLPITPLAFADAILRHRLLDLNLVMRRSLVFALLMTCMAGTFIVLQSLAGAALQKKTGATSLPAQTLAALAVAALFTPTERWIRRIVEMLFNRRQNARLAQLEQLAREIDGLNDLALLRQALVERLARLLELRGAALYWLDAASGEYRLLETTAHDGWHSDATVCRTSALIVHLAARSRSLAPGVLPIPNRGRHGGTGKPDAPSLSEAALVLPMSARGSLVGFLALGARQDDEPFSPAEKSALASLTSVAVYAFQRAELTRRLNDLERESATLRDRLRQLEATPPPQPTSGRGKRVRSAR